MKKVVCFALLVSTLAADTGAPVHDLFNLNGDVHGFAVVTTSPTCPGLVVRVEGGLPSFGYYLMLKVLPEDGFAGTRVGVGTLQTSSQGTGVGTGSVSVPDAWDGNGNGAICVEVLTVIAGGRGVRTWLHSGILTVNLK